jgi:hypothetical protein
MSIASKVVPPLFNALFSAFLDNADSYYTIQSLCISGKFPTVVFGNLTSKCHSNIISHHNGRINNTDSQNKFSILFLTPRLHLKPFLPNISVNMFVFEFNFTFQLPLENSELDEALSLFRATICRFQDLRPPPGY